MTLEAGTLDGNRFDGTANGTLNGTAPNGITLNAGQYSGQLFGGSGEEVGGSIAASGTSDSGAVIMQGTFIGR